MLSRLRACLPVLIAACLLSAQEDRQWKHASPGFEWSFPADHWARRQFRTEWWYFTGHLQSIDNPRSWFGYQFTFFRIGLANPRPTLDSNWASGAIVMGHAAVSDFTTEKHDFSEVLYRETPFLGGFPEFPNRLVAWSLAPAGTEGKWTLHWNGSAFDIHMVDDRRQIAFDLATVPQKPMVFQGPGGYSLKSGDGESASLYYSFTRLRTTGALTVSGRTHRVAGTSWMDKEFSSGMLGKAQVGWDWLSLRLADGRDIMLYSLRNSAGDVDFGSGTLVSANGEPEHLSAGQWAMRPLEWWVSQATGARYPIQWRVEVPSAGLNLKVVTRLPDQENRSELVPGLSYWEGAVRVLSEDGRELGEGYVELTGYSPGGRLPL